MCLIVVAWKAHPDYPLLLLANRDEFRGRPTAPLHAWEDTQPVIYAGRDEEQGGTWLGVTPQGRFASVTNLRRQELAPEQARSRGWLVRDFLLSRQLPSDYMHHVQQEAQRYRGFNLLTGNPRSLVYFSNDGKHSPRLLTPGIYSLSNAPLGTPWPKTEEVRVAFTRQISRRHPDVDELFELMRDQTRYAPHLLPDTGIGAEREEALSSIFIDLPQYATRSTTLMAWDPKGNVTLRERSYRSADSWENVALNFQLDLS